MTYKLGRKSPDYTQHRNWLEDYFTKLGAGVAPPSSWPHFKTQVDRITNVALPMYENDIYGDCTIAGIAHVYGALTKYASGAEALFTNDVITETYERNCPGFDPIGDINDNGCVMQTVLQDQTVNGMVDVTGKTHKLLGYAQLKAIGPKWLSVALDVFGSVYLGVNLPQSAQQQFSAGQPWTYVKGSPIVGGHCITLGAANETPGHANPFTLVTWGNTVQASWPWLNTYVEEAWVVLTEDWLNANGDTIDGFDLAQLQADMQYCS
jgi:hypothetical protein